MWLTLLQVVACAAGSSGCGGGGGDSAAETVLVAAAAGPTAVTTTATAATSPAPASAPAPSPSVAATNPPAAGITFSFGLTQARTTSAGIYDTGGNLVRTLWRGQRLLAGTHTRTWDQRADNGTLLTDAVYTVKVVHHDMSYKWEGVVGNSSLRENGALPHRSFAHPSSLAADAGYMHYAAGYNEAQNAIHGFDPQAPQNARPAVQLLDPFIGAAMVASDGRRLYFSNNGGLARRSFVAAFDLATRRQAVFANGSPLCLNYFDDKGNCYAAQSYASVLNLRDDLASPPTGLAVQRDGSQLAVAYGGDGEVRLYDKTSGRHLRSIAVRLPATGLNHIAFAPGGDLWVLTNSGAERWTTTGLAVRRQAVLDGLAAPLAITVDGADEDGVWIADGAARQQLRRFDRNGQPVATLGTTGGSVGIAAVSRDRLCFQGAAGKEQTALAVDAQRALWVIDTCNNRILQFPADGSVGQQVAYVPSSYVAAADPGNPSRVFANFLEFRVEYDRVLGQPGAWTLVRNWLNVLPPPLRDRDSANWQWGGLRSVQTFPNGRTLAQMAANGRFHIVELGADGTLLPVHTLPLPASGETLAVMYENGDIGWSRTADGRQAVMRRKLLRFDLQGPPVWAAEPVELASAPTTPTSPHYRIGTFAGVLGPRFPLTDGGRVIFFDPSVTSGSAFHLGAVANGNRQWMWQASPTGALDGLGAFQSRQVDSHMDYGGNTVMASGRDIVFGFHGEGYTDLGNGRVGQANQFMHFRDDGMFLGQFGQASTRAKDPAEPGLSGNAFSPTLLNRAGQLYLYHNDESTHGGIHRWRLAGTADVRQFTGLAPVRSTITLR